MLLATLRAGFGIRLKTIQGLEVVAPSTNAPVPCAWFDPPTAAYHGTMERGMDEFNYRVRVLVAAGDTQEAQKDIEAYLSGHGTRSVRAALETTVTGDGLGEAMVRVGAGNSEPYDRGDTAYSSVIFDVQVMVSGTT